MTERFSFDRFRRPTPKHLEVPPERMEYVQPQLDKPGLRFKADHAQQTFRDLLTAGRIERGLLKKVGFMIVEDYHPEQQPLEYPSNRVEPGYSGDTYLDLTGSQWLHRDGRDLVKGEPLDILTLRCATEPETTDPFTSLMSVGDYTKAFSSFLQDLHMEQKRRQLWSYFGIDRPEPLADNRLMEQLLEIKSELANQGPQFQQYQLLSKDSNHLLREAFLAHCRKLNIIYDHVWKSGQLLVLDNVGMVHGKTYSSSRRPQPIPIGRRIKTYREFLMWDSNTTVKSTLETSSNAQG